MAERDDGALESATADDPPQEFDLLLAAVFGGWTPTTNSTLSPAIPVASPSMMKRRPRARRHCARPNPSGAGVQVAIAAPALVVGACDGDGEAQGDCRVAAFECATGFVCTEAPDGAWRCMAEDDGPDGTVADAGGERHDGGPDEGDAGAAPRDARVEADSGRGADARTPAPDAGPRDCSPGEVRECGSAIGACRPGTQTCVEAADCAAECLIEWVTIAGGAFQMGVEGGDCSQEFENEQPVHEVSVSDFELARTGITVAQFRAYADSGACPEPRFARAANCNWNFDDRDDHPMNCVVWSEAYAFASAAGGRLPTEAEWEYAARSQGQAGCYPWGDHVSCEFAVMDDGGGPAGCGRASTAPVCSASPAGDTERQPCTAPLAVRTCEPTAVGEPYARRRPRADLHRGARQRSR